MKMQTPRLHLSTFANPHRSRRFVIIVSSVMMLACLLALTKAPAAFAGTVAQSLDALRVQTSKDISKKGGASEALPRTGGTQQKARATKADDKGQVERASVMEAFIQQQKLTASDAMTNERFASDVALSGDTAVIGRYGSSTYAETISGKAYVYVRNGTTWTQQQILTASDGAVGDRFGNSVNIDGETIIVGSGNSQGSIYVFVRSGTTWTQQAKITAADFGTGNVFAGRILIDGDTIVVGAALQTVNGHQNQGAVYAFVRSGTTWTLQGQFSSSDGVAEQRFGRYMDISGDTVVVGVPNEGNSFSGNGNGAAYIFTRNGTTWTQQQKLLANDGAASDAFGNAVGIAGETVVVGAPGTSTVAGAHEGGAYVFTRSGTTWTQQQKLTTDTGGNVEGAGSPIAFDGTTILIGAAIKAGPSTPGHGSAYVFRQSGGIWSQQGKLVAADEVNTDAFANHLEVDGDTFLVSAPGDDNNTGSAYIFVPGGVSAPSISINDINFTETNNGETNATFTVSLSSPSSNPVVVRYATASGGTASVYTGAAFTPYDYLATSGTLTFNPQETTKTFNVIVYGETIYENNETFFVNLNDPSNASISDAQGICTIVNDDPLPVITILDSEIYEPVSSYSSSNFTVYLSNASAFPITFNYATSDGTATSGSDYQAVSGAFTVNPLETTVYLNFKVYADKLSEPDETFFLDVSNPTGATLARTHITTILHNSPLFRSLLISEFRLRGANGSSDEFIELFNNGGLTPSISTTDGSAGWTVASSDGVVRCLIPNGTQILPQRHYLCTNSSGYSLSDYGGTGSAVGEATYNSDIPDNLGLALFMTANPANFTMANRMDAVGFSGVPAMYVNGTPLPALDATNADYSFVRKFTGNDDPYLLDTDNDASDFTLVSTTGETFGTSSSSVLGAPGPQNSAAPLLNPTYSRSPISPSLIDPTVATSVAPNRQRNGSGNSGTLAFRRSFTNYTGHTVTRLRFRVVDITTLGSPGGGVGSGQADLRLISATDETVSTTFGPVNVQGTTLEAMPMQTLGGGQNSSLSVQLPGGGLLNNQTIKVQFLMNVAQIGRFRFFIQVEATP
jgi:hypothetical protein